jgi:hypothetical protein
MHNRIQLIEPPVLKGQFCQPRSVQVAIGLDNPRAEHVNDFGKDALARLHERTAQRIGLNDLSAQHTQILRDGALAAA